MINSYSDVFLEIKVKLSVVVCLLFQVIFSYSAGHTIINRRGSHGCQNVLRRPGES